MKKSITRLILIFLLISFVINFSGCSAFLGAMGLNGVRRFHDSHGSIYIYFDKVKLEITSQEDETGIYENLGVAIQEDGPFGTILDGPFELAAYNRGELFILKEDRYYVFNVSEYHSQEGRHNEDIRKEDIKEYTKEEFDEAYPDNASYNWFDE